MRLFKDQAEREWVSWRQVCLQLQELGIDINAHSKLAYAIKLWGEELIALHEQDKLARESHQDALEALREKYEPYWINKT